MANEKILIVDDEKLVRWSLVKKFTEWGYQPLEAETGAAAVQALRRGARRAVRGRERARQGHMRDAGPARPLRHAPHAPGERRGLSGTVTVPSP